MAQRYITDSYLKCLMIQKSFICCMCELNPSQCHRTNNNVSPIPESQISYTFQFLAYFSYGAENVETGKKKEMKMGEMLSILFNKISF